MHMSTFHILHMCVENVTRLSQRVKEKSTMAEPAHKYSYLWENIPSWLYQMNKNTILPSLVFFILHVSQSRFAQAYQRSHIGTLPCCHWKQSHTSRPVNGLSHVSGPTPFQKWQMNRGGWKENMVYKLLHTSHRAIAKATAFHKQKRSGVEMYNYFSIKIWVKGCLFFVTKCDLQNVLNIPEQNLTIMFSSMIWDARKSISWVPMEDDNLTTCSESHDQWHLFTYI